MITFGLFFSFIGIGILNIFSTSLYTIRRYQAKTLMDQNKLGLFFFYPVLKRFYPHDQWENLHLMIGFIKQSLYLLFSVLGFFWFYENLMLHFIYTHFFLVFFLLAFALVAQELLLRVVAKLHPISSLKAISGIVSCYLYLFYPLTALGLNLKNLLITKSKRLKMEEKIPLTKERITSLLYDASLNQYFDSTEQTFLASFLTFRDRVAREIMVPRVDLFALPSHYTIEQCIEKFTQEEYSRVPVYKDNLDTILGVLMYKDLLKVFAQKDCHVLQNSIETLIKPVLYAPENKKISHLFQEFRKKQIHMAIIVNEYGGTEGVVTIEDILEVLFGEIQDEYDNQLEKEYWQTASGNWIVDGKMTIIDLENKLNITIPKSPEYETIAGYVFHKAGTIPAKGWSLIQDHFKLEVLHSNDRFIEKISIIPHKNLNQDS
jgi:CBS domain containing-hemolysin-like protein